MSLVFGIVGFFLAWTPLLGLLAGVAAALLSYTGRLRVRHSHAHHSIAIAGMILSIVVITLGTISTLAWMFGGAIFAGWIQVPPILK